MLWHTLTRERKKSGGAGGLHEVNHATQIKAQIVHGSDGGTGGGGRKVV